MPLIRCVDAEYCNRSNCRFVHPDQPQWSLAAESKLAKRRRAEAAAAAEYEHDSGYGSRFRDKNSARRASASSSTAGWGDGRASPERPPRDPSPGWSAPKSTGGWGSNGGGWGAASPAHGAWGTTADDGWGSKSGDGPSNIWGDNSGSGWGNPEPTSRRTSSSAPKSPVKVPTSPRHERESARSPSRHHSSPSKEKDRDRERHRGRDRDRDHKREEDNTSPSRSHRSHRRSPSPSKLSSRRESNRSPERAMPKTSIAANDHMDVDPPNPSRIEAASSLFAPTHKDSSAVSVPARATTAQPVATTHTTEMPISIPFPRVRQVDGLPPPPLGFAALRPTPSLPSTQSMPPPPPPVGVPPVIPSPPATAAFSKPSPKSPPQSSDATKTHGLPTRPRATSSRSPPQTRTLATPMVPDARSSATPAIPVAPAVPVTQIIVPEAPTLMTPATSVPSAPVTPATLPVARPYEWIESLESLIKQNQVLQNCKKQYKLAEAQEQILLSRGTSVPKRGTGDTAPSLADLRRRIESTESDIQALMAQFAMRMDMFHRPSAAITHVDAGKGNEEALNMARKLSDEVSLLESEMQLLQLTTVKSEELKKLEESVKGSSQAILKERGERTKATEDVKKDVKVLGDDLNRTRIECARLREELISSGLNFDRVRCDAQTARDAQVIVKEEIKTIKLEADTTKADVQTVKTRMGEVGNEVTEIKAEIERLKTKLKTPPPSPAPVPVSPATTSGKRARNGVLPSSNAMEVDELLPPAKRVRTIDPLRPSPFVDSTTPFGSPRSIRGGGPSRKELLERIDALEDLVETLQGDILQAGTDVQDQLEEFNERLGLSEERVVNMTAVTEARSESAPPGTTTKSDFVRAAGRSSAPPAQTTFPASWNGPVKLPSVAELPSDDAISQMQIDLDSMMKQVVGLWEGEGEWPAHVQMNLCKALGIESLDDVFKSAPAPAPVVNGKTHAPEGDWAALFKGMKEEQAHMREEMKKERAEQDARMKMMMERLERTEEALDKSVKRRDEVEREYETLKGQQTEQRQLLVHLQSVVDSLPKPGNGMLSPEGLLQDAVRNGTSPVQQELAALRKLATTVPHLLALAGISADKDN